MFRDMYSFNIYIAGIYNNKTYNLLWSDFSENLRIDSNPDITFPDVFSWSSDILKCIILIKEL